MKGRVQDIGSVATGDGDFPRAREGVVHATRVDAQADTEHHDGNTSE